MNREMFEKYKETVDVMVPKEVQILPGHPDGDLLHVAVLGQEYVVFVALSHQFYAPAPSQNGFGQVASLAPSHANYDKTLAKSLHALQVAGYSDEDLIDAAREQEPDAIPVTYLEVYDEIIWRVSELELRGFWFPSDDLVKEAQVLSESARKVYMRQCAEEACGVYSQWMNGNVYEYQIWCYVARFHESGQLFDQRNDYRFDNPVIDENLTEMYGWDHARECTKETLLRLLESLVVDE